ncbi:tail completion protein gp17 [Priestia endophytica]|uniref:tail completion protein gp17 n=1 Tax=Priestia endophytica TaxID=135735 RepID=UPI0020411B27|nr:hypothetical protein [Priestia endophytica]MCM3536594.1 hypothetical protein [Priestia endophytica]
MNIYDLLDELLDQTNVEHDAIRLYVPDGEESPETYITYARYDENGVLQVDDVEKRTAIYVQVDVWSKKSPFKLAEQVKSILKENGFNRRSVGDTYEHDTRLFRVYQRFYYAYNN